MKKRLTLMVLCLFMVSILATPASAQEKSKYTDAQKIKILQSVAYFTKDSNAEKYDKQLVNMYTQMNDDEFRAAIENNLRNIVAKVKSGSNIYWNKEFVDKVIKTDFKNIYNDIAPQVRQQEEILNRNDFILPAYTADSNERTFSVYGDNVLGWHLFGLFCNVSWSWDNTKITDVTPSTWGECYAPTWEYKKLVRSSQTKKSDTWYKVYKKGEFVSSYAGTIIQTAYLWLDINVYAGGDSSYTSGGS
ncbi:MAG: hypothetical protein K6T65_06855 [Peptococcaceae bacterium]|nr:hypothetical protein [Peptococcaceae bacterium]